MLDSAITTTALSLLLVLFLLSRLIKYHQQLQAVGNVPGYQTLFHPLFLPGNILPTVFWNVGLRFTWKKRHSLYRKIGNDTFSLISFLIGPPTFYTSNMDVARQISGGGHRTSFEKPEFASKPLLLWGMNLLSAERETWRKHRRIMGPAFNNNLHKLVWNEAQNTFRDMVTTEGWKDKNHIEISALQPLTYKFALLMIVRCGFGLDFDWATPPKSPNGDMTVQQALRISLDAYKMAIFTPKWIQNLPLRRMREMRSAHSELVNFMLSEIKRRKDELRTDAAGGRRGDVFTLLIEANENQETKLKLADHEVIGNVFGLLLAGQESTAHTMATALAFLAVHDDVQAEVYDQISSVAGVEETISFDKVNLLDKVTAVFLESMRMFPAAYLMVREAHEDTVLHVPNPVGHKGTTSVPIPKGTQIVVDMIGVQYNPRYFDQPEVFKPSRWYGVSPDSDSITAFSLGPRSCTGRKFATLEGVCFIATLLREYEVQPILRSGETKGQWKDRVLDAEIILTLRVHDIPLRLVSRK